MTHAEIFSVVEGALDETRYVSPENADETAELMANELRDAAELQGFEDWQVYILPHYCADLTNPHSGESCVCVQYLTDHHPAFSSESEVTS